MLSSIDFVLCLTVVFVSRRLYCMNLFILGKLFVFMNADCLICLLVMVCGACLYLATLVFGHLHLLVLVLCVVCCLGS